MILWGGLCICVNLYVYMYAYLHLLCACVCVCLFAQCGCTCIHIAQAKESHPIKVAGARIWIEWREGIRERGFGSSHGISILGPDRSSVQKSPATMDLFSCIGTIGHVVADNPESQKRLVL